MWKTRVYTILLTENELEYVIIRKFSAFHSCSPRIVVMNSIISFRFSNFRSFYDEVEFSFVANRRISDDMHGRTAAFDVNKQLRLLHTTAVYGPNASGKSNLATALQVMRVLVVRASNALESIPVEPFQLRKDNNDPSLFELTFLVDSTIYRYGFSVSTTKVHEEWLYRIEDNKEIRLFDRKDDLFNVNARSFQEGKNLVQYTRADALFLPVVAQLNGKIANSIRLWFRDSLRVISGLHDYDYAHFTQRECMNVDRKRAIQSIISNADTGIEEIEIRKISLAAKLPQDMPAKVRQALLDLESDDEYEVQTRHRVYDKEGKAVDTIAFSLDYHESAGTQHLFALSGPIQHILNSGGVLVVDEFGARMHPLLSQSIVNLFHSSLNTKHAQLLVMTHDLTLMDDLRRDQIWFVSKDAGQGSHLQPLLDYAPRKDSAIGKNYLQGRYGAIPLIDRLINEEE